MRLDIKNLLKKYKIAPQWFDGLKNYLLTNNPDFLGRFIGIAIKIEIDKDNDQETLCLQINEDTTIEDIKKAWPWIKFHQERLSYRKQKKFQPIRKLELYKRIIELADEKKSYEKIAEIIRDEFEIDFGYDDVSRALRRYKKQIGHK